MILYRARNSIQKYIPLQVKCPILHFNYHKFMIFTEEDTYGNYAETLLKYFMAEGIVTSHALFVASQNAKPSKLVSEVPAVVTESSETKTNVLDSSKQMEIAWRYQNMKVVDSSPTGSNAFGHFYNLTKKMTEDEISKADMTFWDGENVRWNAEVFHNQAYIDLLKNIHATLKKENFSFTSEPKKRNVLRIALHSLGSRLWISDKEEDSQKDLTSFLYYLRAMLRDYFTVATITFPAHNFDNSVNCRFSLFFSVARICFLFSHSTFRVLLCSVWNICPTMSSSWNLSQGRRKRPIQCSKIITDWCT